MIFRVADFPIAIRVQELVELRRVVRPDSEKPAVAVGVLIHRLRRIIEGRVDREPGEGANVRFRG